MSLMYEGIVLRIGFKKWSRNLESFSVGEPHSEIIGLPGMRSLIFGLCIFGKR